MAAPPGSERTSTTPGYGAPYPQQGPAAAAAAPAPPPDEGKGWLHGDKNDDPNDPNSWINALETPDERVGATAADGSKLYTTGIHQDLDTSNMYTHSSDFMLGRTNDFTGNQANQAYARGAAADAQMQQNAAQIQANAMQGQTLLQNNAFNAKNDLVDQGRAAADYGMQQGQAVASRAAVADETAQAVGRQLATTGLQTGATLQNMGLQTAANANQAGQNIYNYGQRQGEAITSKADTSAGNLNQFARGSQDLAAQAANRSALAEGPSAAQAQLQSGLNASQASNLAMARSGRGFGGSASALMAAQGQNAAAGQQAANSAAMLRAQEAQNYQQVQMQQRALNDQTSMGLRQQALSGLGGAGNLQLQGASQGAATSLGAMQSGSQLGLAGSQTGAGIYGQGANTQMAGLQAGGDMRMTGAQMGVGGLQSGAALGMQGQQMGMAGSQAGYGLAESGLNSAYGLGQSGLQAATQTEQQGIQNAIQGQQMGDDLWRTQSGIDLAREGQAVQQYGIKQRVETQNNAANNQLLGAGLQAAATGGALLLASDERAKTDIKSADVMDVFEHTNPYSYEYKDKNDGDGRFWGPMAQDLEKTEAGASAVVQGPGGKKMVNTGRLSLLNTAGISSLNKEFKRMKQTLAQLEKR